LSKKASVILSAVVFTLAFAGSASASLFSGNYNYAITGQTSFPACTSASPIGGNSWTDNFASVSGSNTIASDPVTFSDCDGTTGFLEDGTFLMTDGTGDSAAGTFTGTLVGNTLSDGTGGDIFTGGFVITSATGYYAGTKYNAGSFEVVTGAVNTPAFVTGTFDFQETPEPVTTLLCGSGLALLAFSRKLLPRRS
jgi:hypothetical protein